MATMLYVLQSTASCRHSYVGITGDFTRRLRQHNGEIVGGACRTRSRRPWRGLVLVRGFHGRHLLQFEWALNHGGRRPTSVISRLRDLRRVLALERVTRTAPPSPPVTLEWLCPAAERVWAQLCADPAPGPTSSA